VTWNSFGSELTPKTGPGAKVHAVKVDLRMPDAVGNLFKTSLNEFATFGEDIAAPSKIVDPLIDDRLQEREGEVASSCLKTRSLA